MELNSFGYVIWNVFLFLELLGVKRITQPKFRTIRWFLGFCALRDISLFIIDGHRQLYWDVGWASKQIEMIWLAWIAGYIASLDSPKYEWPMRIPALGVAIISLSNLPFYATAERMQEYQFHAQLIVIVTVLIACLLTIRRAQFSLAGGVAALAGSGLVSAVMFAAGNSSSMVASLIWIGGLILTLTALKANPACPCISRPQIPDERIGQASGQSLSSTPEAEAEHWKEWIYAPYHRLIQ